MFARRFLSLIALAAIAIIVLLSLVGCTKDRPTGPIIKPSAAAKAIVRGGTVPSSIQGEKDYPIIYSYVSNDYWVYTYSSQTGQIIDSVCYGHYPFTDMRFSSDGHYAFYTNTTYTFDPNASQPATWVTDYRTGDTLSIRYGVWGGRLLVSSDGRYLLISSALTVRLLEIPDLNIVWESNASSHWGAAAINSMENVAYVPNANSDSLLVVDFRTFPVRTRSVALRGLDGIRVFGKGAAVSADGRTIILKVARFAAVYNGYIQFLDSETFKLLWQYRPNLSGPIVHPDGERLFFWDCSHFDIGNPGTVWVFSLKTFEARQIFGGYILFDCGPSFFNPGPGNDDKGMAITPDGKYAFIINGGEGLNHGPILKMDLRTYKIVDQFCPPGGVSRLIRIYPHEIKQGVDHVPEVF